MKRLAICLLLLSPHVAHAEDVSAHVMTLKTPSAECRYLAQRHTFYRAAVRTRQAALERFLTRHKSLQHGDVHGEDPKELQKLSQELEVLQSQLRAMRVRAASETDSIVAAIRARRGSLAQC